MKLIIFTDGASRGNPGPASYGFTISDGEGKVVHEKGKCIGITNNNVAGSTSASPDIGNSTATTMGNNTEENI